MSHYHGDGINRLDRRVLLRGGLTLGAGLAGAGSLARFGVAAQQDAVTPVASGTSQIVAAANAFLDTLDETQRAAVSFPFPSTQTVATVVEFGARDGEQFGDAIWSNYPISDVIRPGLRVGDLADVQREAAMALLAAALSPQGYQKVLNIMESDQVLSEGGTNYASGRDNYVLGLFGTPSESEK